ncbi:MAG TPA: ribosome biogenesis GTP-binding protein YihA/YsxC [Caulobacteraceae bacterium]|nr:ribosome biogenesis GTP-binding protein YihA/YsxC [Caulobacteraceae bacterium]
MDAAALEERLFDPEMLEAARILFAREAVFERGAARLEDLPPPDLPEIAFAGRSNVGKSSLLNALTSRKGLARASNAPGRTREINFFMLDRRLRLVDLPGYGFAAVSRGFARHFQDLARLYLRGRPNLRRVYLLLDARHGVKDSDEEAMAALDRNAVSYQAVLTKADKLNALALEPVIERARLAIQRHPAAFPRLLATSAIDGAGLPELRAEIALVAGALR